MKTTMDSVGRVVVPKALRDELGLVPGSEIDISRYGAGIALIPGGRTARVVEDDGHLVITGDRTLSDEEMYALIDAGRR